MRTSTIILENRKNYICREGYFLIQESKTGKRKDSKLQKKSEGMVNIIVNV